ncbi:MAG: HEAT repeat domain-containing protein [Microcoleus sp. PH2017_10_PVI_O_A]|uniref:HEAT repeat domain-containing protein n=1 Tax=unclassified Microcoleus TaxID=2642155 RepID=UPI001D93CC23|nr:MULTISPECIES: HEAT repeat domain-containing protein [unclassified Microcoleus]TAE84030.1 MAG: hypothetical protein EAZ83_07290 [Oscillatoriales cyanobacterium]MCC3405652.1 HEAT repeat domain-containing protein [Microcoleus sp. PH2017_10_PVI_O_A]MCC3459581.1 HEAT repeat domain-containing protein [Microcoleus sp. PH2017_11_PCY_U_A]MCC3478117.1 HEAT repeat domain-containing protein [Microcoleus sp. PH2017_12_PCY_D_A]MCC3558934.1 HEAT repeat domain-containing protein [Microcoleus sp. PH2017_27_
MTLTSLNQALHRILKWLEEHKPEAISLLQPGLSNREIEELVKDLPIHFPQEVYDLYKWKNGSEDSPAQENVAYIFNGFSFYPLEDAIKIYRHKLIERNWSTRNINTPGWIEIFFCYIGKEVGGYVVIDGSQETRQVIFTYNKDGDEVTARYTSLTSMITTIAECYETGAYSISKHEDFTGTVIKDYQKAHQIWCKHNSEIVDSLLEKLQELSSYQSFLDIAADIRKLKDPRTVKLLIRALQRPVLTYDDLWIQELAAKMLGELGDAGAVEPLISALQNDSWMTQYWAARSLGQVKYKPANDPWIEPLKDSHNRVRQMAVWALGEIGDLRAVDSLIDALRDSDYRVKQVANQAWDKLVAKFPEIDEEIPF